jgi:hypothetical protein
MTEVSIDGSLAEAITVFEREVTEQAAADEMLLEWLLPKYSLALRRMRAARAGNIEKHQAAFDFFAAVCGGLGHSALPATPESVSMYLMTQLDMGKPVKTVRAMRDAIEWAHRDAGLANPCDTDIVDVVFGTEEIKAKVSPKKKVKPTNGS